MTQGQCKIETRICKHLVQKNTLKSFSTCPIVFSNLPEHIDGNRAMYKGHSLTAGKAIKGFIEEKEGPTFYWLGGVGWSGCGVTQAVQDNPCHVGCLLSHLFLLLLGMHKNLIFSSHQWHKRLDSCRTHLVAQYSW